MELNITYHWTYLDYQFPHKADKDWGPVATASIEAWVDLPDPEENKHLHGIYKHLMIPITGTMDPKQEIIQAIEKFGKEKNITVEMDFLVTKNSYWDEPF